MQIGEQDFAAENYPDYTKINIHTVKEPGRHGSLLEIGIENMCLKFFIEFYPKF